METHLRVNLVCRSYKGEIVLWSCWGKNPPSAWSWSEDEAFYRAPFVWLPEAGPPYPMRQACCVLCNPPPRPWATRGQWSSSSFRKELFYGGFFFFFFFFIFLFTFSGFDFPLFSFSGWTKFLFKKNCLQFLVVICAIIKIFFFTLNVCICPWCVRCFLIGMLLFILLLGCMWKYVCTQKWSVLCVYVFMYRDICISMLFIDLFLFYIISLFLIPMLYVYIYTYTHVKNRKKK